jgi:hypothetical protein
MPAAPSEPPIQYEFTLQELAAPSPPPPPPSQRAPLSPQLTAPPSPMRGRSDRRRATMQALVTSNAQPSFSPASSPNVRPPPPPPPPPPQQQTVDPDPVVDVKVNSPSHDRSRSWAVLRGRGDADSEPVRLALPARTPTRPRSKHSHRDGGRVVSAVAGGGGQ